MKETRAFNHLKRLHPRADWQRIETWAGLGIPDVNGCKNGIEIWCELKQVNLPRNGIIKLPSTKKSVKTQQGWMIRRARAGGRVFYGIMVNSALHILGWQWGKVLLSGMPYHLVKKYSVDPKRIFDV
jgi:hypothetical protein